MAVTRRSVSKDDYGGEGRGSRNQGVVILVCDYAAGLLSIKEVGRLVLEK